VRVLVIPEDPTLNGYILKPLVEMLLSEAGKPTARVTVLTNPRVRGYDEAVRVVRDELSSRYGFMDLWLFFPDADRASDAAMRDLERSLRAEDIALLCCLAEPEVEVYACVAYREEVRGSWHEARSNPRFKETVFEPLLRTHGDPRRPGGGRGAMTERSIKQRNRFFRLCPEVADLRDRIVAILGG
jgi:hypothetical protein